MVKEIYEKVTEHGLEIPLEVCKLANISDRAVINIYDRKIEIRPLFISQEKAEMVANKYLIINIGDALISQKPSLSEVNGIKVWKVQVIHSRTKHKAGSIYIDAVSGDVLQYSPNDKI